MKNLQQTLWISIFILLTTGMSLAQAPEIQWQKSLGGSESDRAQNVQQTIDGGYIIAGSSASNDGDVSENQGGSDYWIVKLNTTGTIQWQKSLGGSGNEYAQYIRETADGGYIVAGFSASNDGDVTGNHGNYDYWIVKLNPQGNIQWQKSLGGSESDTAYSVQQTEDGGYLIAGISSSTDGDVTGNHGGPDYWIVKLNTNGDILEQNSFGGTGFELVRDIQTTKDSGYIIAGHSNSNNGDVTGNNGGFDYWIVKISETGSMVWQKSLGGSENEFLHSIKQTEDGGYIVSGSSQSNDGDVTGNQGGFDYWIVKLDSAGNIEWQKSMGGSADDNAYEVHFAPSGYIVTGHSESNDGDITGNHGDFDYWVVRLNEEGDILWEKSLGGSTEDAAHSIQPTTDGGYIIAGFSESNDGDVTGNHGGADYWIVKLEPDPLSMSEFNNRITVYPNPVTTVLNIVANEPIKSVAVFNTFGQQVHHQQLETTSGQINLSVLTPGIYVVKVDSANKEATYKIIKK